MPSRANRPSRIAAMPLTASCANSASPRDAHTQRIAVHQAQPGAHALPLQPLHALFGHVQRAQRGEKRRTGMPEGGQKAVGRSVRPMRGGGRAAAGDDHFIKPEGERRSALRFFLIRRRL